MQFKTFCDSKTTLAQICLPHQTNSSGNIHGGEMMKMMDSAAGVAAMKYSGTNVVTARVDELCFKHSVHIGELVTCCANVVYAGKSSMETFVTVEAENPLDGTRKIALTAFFTMVALDENGVPHPVPSMKEPKDYFEKKLYEEGMKRYLKYKKRKK